ncbi:Lipophilin-B, partial [Macaca mulatta]
MRLSVCLLLVTLALCCYQANAVVCPALFSEISGFSFINEPVFKLKLAKYDAPPEAVAAILEVKKCTDQISLEKHLLIEKVQNSAQLRTASC